MPRHGNFIDQFLAYTENRGSPRLYRLWSAIFAISAAVERKVWVRTARGKWYANQYLVLVGPAGIGKSLCTTTVYALLDALRTPETPFHIAPTSVTKASLIDALANAERRVVRPMELPAVNQFNSLTVVANELGVFLPSWEGDFMNTLTDMWDNGRYHETRRTMKIDINIPAAQLSIMSATTPAYLTRLLPEGAWEEGFMSRTLICYSGENIYTDMFTLLDNDDEAFNALIHDLTEIHKLWGQMEFTDEFMESFRAWARAGGPPAPDHPRLHGYSTRRGSHFLKIAMVASLAESNDLVLTQEHFRTALGWMVELETFMPDVFKSMRTGGDMEAMKECWHFAYTIWVKKQEPVPEQKIVQFLAERIPAHSVERVIDTMERAGLLKKQFMASGGHGYEPKAQKAA